MNLVAILKNAYHIGYEKEQNNLWLAHFSLPIDDPKRTEVTSKRFIELWDHDKRIGLFIINPKKTVKNESDRSITYNCEHVLSLLHSDVLFGYHQFSNLTTRDVLDGLLDLQETKHWVLGQVDFTRYFHYSWENENSLLNAIMSVPNSFDESFAWTWDDSVYPFVLNLVRPTDEKVDTVRFGRNLKGIEKDEDPTGIVNRIYPLGNGEGVNQLTIREVNNGVPYLEDADSVAKYGLQKQIWVDRRFEHADELKTSAQALLNKYKDPQVTVSIDCIDYELIDPYKLVKYDVGKILGVYDQDTDTDTDLRIMKITKDDIYGSPSDIKFDVGNVREDIGTTITDLQKKQLVNDTYSQGATNIDSRDFQDNCDPDHPAVIRFPIPDDVVNINQMILTFETQKFRAYERAIKGGGAIVTSTAAGGSSRQTSSSGGGSEQTSSSGGGVSKSTESGGDTTRTSSSGGGTQSTTGSKLWDDRDMATSYAIGTGDNHYHNAILRGEWFTHNHSFSVPAHTHTVSIPAHSHEFSTPNHSHTVNIPNHEHTVDIPAHTHEITLPDHTHAIEFGIFELDDTPNSMDIEVDGTVLPLHETSGENIDLLPYLQKDSGGNISRGRYAEIKITPNALARINATVTSRLFIQSRIGEVM